MALLLLRNELLQTAALICIFFGVATLLLEARFLFQRGLPLALDFWLAAGLLRLSAQADWPSIVTAAAIVCLRKLLNTALAAARRT